MSSDPDPEVDELCIAVGDLVVKVSKAKAAPSTGYGTHSAGSSADPSLPRDSGALAAVVGSSATSEAASWSVVELAEASSFAPWSREWESALLAASSPEEVLAVDLSVIDHLSNRFRTTNAGWSPRARLGRAFRAGLIARQVLDKRYVKPANLDDPTLPCRFYIILRAASGRLSGWTDDYIQYRDQIITKDGGFAAGTVSQAFASRAEAEAYLLGAMASGAAAPMLSEDAIRALWEAAPTGALPGVYLIFIPGGYLVFIRHLWRVLV